MVVGKSSIFLWCIPSLQTDYPLSTNNIVVVTTVRKRLKTYNITKLILSIKNRLSTNRSGRRLLNELILLLLNSIPNLETTMNEYMELDEIIIIVFNPLLPFIQISDTYNPYSGYTSQNMTTGFCSE